MAKLALNSLGCSLLAETCGPTLHRRSQRCWHLKLDAGPEGRDVFLSVVSGQMRRMDQFHQKSAVYKQRGEWKASRSYVIVYFFFFPSVLEGCKSIWTHWGLHGGWGFIQLLETVQLAVEEFTDLAEVMKVSIKSFTVQLYRFLGGSGLIPTGDPPTGNVLEPLMNGNRLTSACM